MVGVDGISDSSTEEGRDLEDDLDAVKRRVKLLFFFIGFSEAL